MRIRSCCRKSTSSDIDRKPFSLRPQHPLPLTIRRRYLLIFPALALLCLGGINMSRYLRANAHLDRIVARITPVERRDEAEIVTAVVRYVSERAGPETTGRIHAFDPMLRVLKAGPMDVDLHRGHCGNLARLTIALLHRRSIDARKLHLYDPDAAFESGEHYVHAVVEARLSGRDVVLDPLFGVVYRTWTGNLASIEDLQDDSTLVASQVPPRYPVEAFIFDQPRGVRWTIMPFGEAIRSALVAVFGVNLVDSIHYPYILERPYLLLGLLYSGSGVLCIVVALLPPGLCAGTNRRAV